MGWNELSKSPPEECDECGALVANMRKHREWHRKERLNVKREPLAY